MSALTNKTNPFLIRRCPEHLRKVKLLKSVPEAGLNLGLGARPDRLISGVQVRNTASGGFALHAVALMALLFSRSLRILRHNTMVLYYCPSAFGVIEKVSTLHSPGSKDALTHYLTCLNRVNLRWLW